MKKPINRNLLKLAILCIAVQDIGNGAATPALGSIIAAFPQYDPSTVQMVGAMPSLFIVIFAPIYAWAKERFPRRRIFLLAAAAFLIGGTAPAFMDNLYAILAMRSLLGASIGVIFPMAADLACDFFEGDERKTMLGWTFAVGSLGGIMFQMLGGYLSGIDWHYTFYAYLVSIIFFAVPTLFLPEPERKVKTADELARPKVRLPGAVWVVSMGVLIWCVFFNTFINNAALIILNEGLGTPAMIGVAFSFLTVGSFISATFFGKISKVLNSFMLSATFLITGIGLGVMYIAYSYNLFVAGIFIAGLGLGITPPSFMAKSTSIAPAALSAFAISAIVSFNGIGNFIQPLVFKPILEFTGQTVGRFPILVGFVGMMVMAVVIYIVNKATKPYIEKEAV